MADSTRTLNASCLCGAAKHQITLPSSAFPLPLHLCHCDSCRRMTGTFALTVIFLPEEYEPTEDTLDKLVRFKFSERITNYHCNICGTQMLAHCWKDAEDHSTGSSWDVCSGTIEKIEGLFELKGHSFISDTLDGGFADFLTNYDGKTVQRWAHHFGQGEQLQVQWEHPGRPEVEPKPTDRLHAHCKCGGVEFWVARPSERSKQASSKWPDLLIPYHTNQQHGLEGKPWWIRDEGRKYLGGVCSCNSCRLDTGMEWVEWAFVPVIDITLDMEGDVPFTRHFGTLKEYRSSKNALRYHCGACGATVFFFGEDRPEVIDISAGLLDAPEGARSETWIEWWCGRLSFREDAMPRAESLTLAVEKGLLEHKARKYPNQGEKKH